MAEGIKFQFAVNARALVEKRKAEHGPQRQDGGKVLVLLISRADVRVTSSVEGFNRTVENYEILLQDTYGAENVTVLGAGYETFPEREPRTEGERKYLESLDFSEIKFLVQAEFAKLIRSISGEEYDQIHIVGHSDPLWGLLFYNTPLVGFKEEKAMSARLDKPGNWPLNPGGKILLVGCGANGGRLKGFLEDYEIAEPGKVFAMEGDFDCEGAWVRVGPDYVPLEEKIIVGRITFGWYHTEQHESIKAMGLWLGIQEARRRQ